jgi:hypothetical protein
LLKKRGFGLLTTVDTVQLCLVGHKCSNALIGQRLALVREVIGATGKGINHPDRGAHRLREEWGGYREVFVVGVRHPDDAKLKN